MKFVGKIQLVTIVSPYYQLWKTKNNEHRISKFITTNGKVKAILVVVLQLWHIN